MFGSPLFSASIPGGGGGVRGGLGFDALLGRGSPGID